MLLRVSSEAIGMEAELSATVGDGDGGVPHGELLRSFAEAATRDTDDLALVRQGLRDAVGDAAFVEAAATVGAFNGLVRVADGTGIPLDDGTRSVSDGFREALGLNAFAGARNTDLEAPVQSPASLTDLKGLMAGAGKPRS